MFVQTALGVAAGKAGVTQLRLWPVAAPPTLPKEGLRRPAAGRGNQMIACLPSRVCRLRALLG
jgi:hypothetical protein